MLKLSCARVDSRVAAVTCSEESLSEAIQDVQAAAEALFESGVDGAELCQVVDNLGLTIEALNQGGLTKQFLGTFNAAGETSACAGMENLTVAGLEALAADQVKELTAKYSAGLEGKMAEYWAKFVAWLKNMWAKVVNWFKSIFVARARYVSALGAVEALTEDVYNGDAKLSVSILNTTANLNKAIDAEKVILNAITKIEGGGSVNIEEINKSVTALESAMDVAGAEKSVKQVFGTAAEFKSYVKKYIVSAKDTGVQKASKAVDKAFKKLIDKAGKAANAADAQVAQEKEKINAEREQLNYALKLIRTENRFIMKLGGELVKVYKAAKTAKAKK